MPCLLSYNAGLFSWLLGELGITRTKSGPVRTQDAEAIGGAPLKMTGADLTTGGAAGEALGVVPQLPGGNRSHAENSGDNGCQKRVLDRLPRHKLHPFREPKTSREHWMRRRLC